MQPSLSRQIKDLETHIGGDLLIRGSRRVSLTETGRVFLDESRLVLAQYERAIESARRAARGVRRSMTAGFDYGLEQKYLFRVSGMMQDQPETELNFRSLPAPLLMKEVRDGSCDLAFVPRSDDLHDLEFFELDRMPLIAVLHQSHPLAQKASISASDLSAETVISASEKMGPALYHACCDFAGRNSAEIHFDQQAGSLTMAISLIQNLRQVALTPSYSPEIFPDDIRMIPLSGDVPEIAMGMIWRSDNTSADMHKLLDGFRPTAG